jgi:hypothetical protein
MLKIKNTNAMIIIHPLYVSINATLHNNHYHNYEQKEIIIESKKKPFTSLTSSKQSKAKHPDHIK